MNIEQLEISEVDKTLNMTIELLKELLEVFPPETKDKFWWPEGLPKLIKKVDELIEKLPE